MKWQPIFSNSTHPESDFQDGPFQFTVAQIDAAPFDDLRQFLIASAQRLRGLGLEAEQKDLVRFINSLPVRDIK